MPRSEQLDSKLPATVPFAPGTISLGLYLHDLPPEEALEELLAQARLADALGYDGVTLSEHHLGFPGYLPNPLQVAGWMLQEMSRAWSGAFPLLLPLRTPAIVAEEIAWLAARFPGRVGMSFAPGYAPADWELAGLAPADVPRRFREALRFVVEALRVGASGPLGQDPAVARLARDPIPLLSAAGGPVAVRRAARLGLGIHPTGPLEDLMAEYRQAGGLGPVVRSSKAWIGEPPVDLIAAQRAGYSAAADGGAYGAFLRATDAKPLAGVIAGSPAEVTDRLGSVLEQSGADALAIKLHVTGITPEQAREQIERFATEVLPQLRGVLPTPASARTRSVLSGVAGGPVA